MLHAFFFIRTSKFWSSLCTIWASIVLKLFLFSSAPTKAANARNVSYTRKAYHINLCWSNPYSAYSPTQKNRFFQNYSSCFHHVSYHGKRVCNPNRVLPAAGSKLTLEAFRGVKLTPPPLDFFGFKFCSLTDCQKLWHNCSLFVNTSFDTN